MKLFSVTLFIYLISLTSLFSKDSQVPLFYSSIRLPGYIGGILTRSDDPGLLFGSSESASSSQSGFGIEYLHSFKSLKAGLAVGLSYRNDDYWKRYFNKYSNNIHAIVELGNNTFVRTFFFDIQFGLMQGALSTNYYPFIGIGPSFILNKDYKRLNICFSPFLFYQGGETKSKIAYDCRYTPPGQPCGGTHYTLHFNTFSFNASLILQLNFIRKNK